MARFQPRGTLGVLYLAAFFLLYCFALVLPELAPLVEPASPEQQQALEQAAADAARAAVRARLPIALGAALLSLWLGIRFELLPGLRR
jgi:hypothetical protein